jgi:hypothetical protein
MLDLLLYAASSRASRAQVLCLASAPTVPDAQVSARAVLLLGSAHALLEPRLERLGALVCFISYSAG